MNTAWTDVLSTDGSAANLLLPSHLTRPTDRESDHSLGNVARLVARFGSAAGNVLLDESCLHFRHPGIDGVVGYKRHGAYSIMLSDPAVAPHHLPALVDAYSANCRQQGLHCIYAVIGSAMASHLRSQGCGVMEFGVEQVLDPRNSVSSPGYKDLRKKLKRARRAGMQVSEYLPRLDGRNEALEHQMNALAQCWLVRRDGPQTYWAHIDLFRTPTTTRWFYGTVNGKVVGLLSTMQLDRMDGYLLEHILWLPEAPVGTSELLVAQVLETLADENCTYASFGPAPGPALGEISGFNHITERSCRFIYRLAQRLFHLDSRTLHRQKYRPAASQPLYLAFDPARIRAGTLMALGHAFNFSVA